MTSVRVCLTLFDGLKSYKRTENLKNSLLRAYEVLIKFLR